MGLININQKKTWNIHIVFNHLFSR
jgi:hypothetical protein